MKLLILKSDLEKLLKRNSLFERKLQGGLAVRIPLDFLSTARRPCFSSMEKVEARPAKGRKFNIDYLRTLHKEGYFRQEINDSFLSSL